MSMLQFAASIRKLISNDNNNNKISDKLRWTALHHHITNNLTLLNSINWLRSSFVFVIYANYVHESLWKKPFWTHQFKWESSCDLLTHVIILIIDLPKLFDHWRPFIYGISPEGVRNKWCYTAIFEHFQTELLAVSKWLRLAVELRHSTICICIVNCAYITMKWNYFDNWQALKNCCLRCTSIATSVAVRKRTCNYI